MRLIDTHCHLDVVEFDADRAQVLAATRTARKSEAMGREAMEGVLSALGRSDDVAGVRRPGDGEVAGRDHQTA